MFRKLVQDFNAVDSKYHPHLISAALSYDELSRAKLDGVAINTYMANSLAASYNEDKRAMLQIIETHSNLIYELAGLLIGGVKKDFIRICLTFLQVGGY